MPGFELKGRRGEVFILKKMKCNLIKKSVRAFWTKFYSVDELSDALEIPTIILTILQ